MLVTKLSVKPQAVLKLRQWLAKVVLVVCVPFLLILLLEGLLAMAGWFEPIRLLLPVHHKGQLYVYSNPEFGRLFLPRKELPMPSPIWVPVNKPAGVIRIVLLGESAAAGFPHPEFNLARVVESLWASRYPDRQIEVINLTMVAVNSHILRIFAREAMTLQPDAVILYAGHNEVIGPFGPASVFGRAFASRRTIQANLWVRNTRVGRAMNAAYQAWSSRRGREMPRWAGLDEFSHATVSYDDVRLDIMADHARENFRDIIDWSVRQGARVLVCVPGVNLTDWPPLESAPPILDDESALAAWQRGDISQITSGWQVFQIARRHENFGDWETAWPLYRLALDLDQHRFRADSRIRKNFLGMIGSWPANLVRVVDIDRALHEDNPLFMTDQEYFCEHVHLTFVGRAMVGGAMVEGIAALLGVEENISVSLTISDLAMRMLFTPMDEIILWQAIRDLLTLGVFAGQPEVEDRQSRIVELLEHLQVSANAGWGADNMLKWYKRAEETSPNDAMLHYIAGRHFLNKERPGWAINALVRGVDLLPSHALGRLLLAQVLINQGRFTEAENHIAEAVRFAPELPRVAVLRGELYARTGRFELARRDLEAALVAVPGHYSTMVNLANVYLLLGEDSAAMKTFAGCLEVNPSDPGVLNNYAWLLATSGQTTPAQRQMSKVYVQRAIQARPDFAPYRATLALAHAATGHEAEARQTAASVIPLLEQLGDTNTVRELREHLARMGVAL